MAERIVFHVDVNSAFLSWEAVYRLQVLKEEQDIRLLPAAIGGDSAARRGIVLAKSILAKQYGVTTGEALMTARKKCPELLVLPPRREWYEKCSKAFLSILQEYSPVIEQFSIDEAFMDMTGMQALFGEPVACANQIRERIYKELGFTVNIGISNNKLLAKMASDFKKPNLVHTLFPEEIPRKMWPLPVGELFLAGHSSVEKLQAIGIRTIGDLACSKKEIVAQHLKKQGELLWDYANGIDDAPVECEESQAKCYGNSTTLPHDVTTAAEAKRVLLSLSESVAMRLRKDSVKAEVVSVTIKSSEFRSSSHQRSLQAATNLTEELYETACKLFDELWDKSPIRLLGVQTSKIVSEEASGRQLSMFEERDYEKLEKLEKAMDTIRFKYGSQAVKRASFLEKEQGNGKTI